MTTYTIGEAARQLDMTADTLRYYEKIGLLPKVKRAESGIRLYSDKDVSRLKFIRRAQQMNFTLVEIGDLLKMREDPQHVRHDVRQLTANKLSEVKVRLNDLVTLKNELTLLLNLCQASEEGCPIIDKIDENE